MVAPVIAAALRAALRGGVAKSLASGGGNAPDLSSLSGVGGQLAASISVDFSQIDRLFDNMARVPAKVDDAMAEFCRQVVKSAKLRAPVDTGKLKWSIRFQKKGEGEGEGDYQISADAPYAAYVEYGTRKTRAQPFMQPAINAYRQRFINNVKKIAGAKK